MRRAIDKNDLAKVTRLSHTASVQDVFYAAKTGKDHAATILVLENDEIAKKLYDSCSNLTLAEKTLLLRGTDPKDVASVINGLRE